MERWRRHYNEVRPHSALGYRPPALTVRAAWQRYLAHAKSYYRLADGAPTRTPENIDHAMRPMLALHGEALASKVTPTMLEVARERMIDAGISVAIINQRVGMIRRVRKWLAARELIPAGAWHALLALEPLKPGRTRAKSMPPCRRWQTSGSTRRAGSCRLRSRRWFSCSS